MAVSKFLLPIHVTFCGLLLPSGILAVRLLLFGACSVSTPQHQQLLKAWTK
jgi:hypothetical protein